MSDWTTRLEAELTASHGVEEVHNAWFVPRGWSGKGPAVGLLIPECEMQFVEIGPDGVPMALVNRPQINKSVKRWLIAVCEIASKDSAALSVACDTVEQLERAVTLVGRKLPSYERVPLERMRYATTRRKAGLN